MRVLAPTQRKKSPYSELFWSAFFPDFPGLNTERYSPNAGKSRKNADQNNSEYDSFYTGQIHTEMPTEGK